MSERWSAEQVKSFFRQHWTVRKYKAVPMPPADLEAILFAAQRAPTDATAQMYSFVRLIEPSLRTEIAEATANPHIGTASEAFLVCADLHRLDATLRVHGHSAGTYPNVAIHFAIGDAAMAGQNMLIAAEMLGYRGCWIGGVLNGLETVSRRVGLPEGVFPFAALTIGVPDEPEQYRPRLPREQVIHENSYRSLSESELRRGAEAMAGITARGNWPQTLARYFGAGGSMESREPVLRAHLDQRIRGRN